MRGSPQRLGGVRLRARAGDVGPLPGPHHHAAAAARDGHAAACDEHAEHAIARTGEETGAAHRDETEGAADLHGRFRVRTGSIEQERAGLEADLAAGIDQVAVDHHARPLAQLEHGVAPEPHGQARGQPGGDLIVDEQRRRTLEIAALGILFGEGLAFQVLDGAGLALALRSGRTRQQHRQRHRRGAQKPAPAETIGALVRHATSPSIRDAPIAVHNSTTATSHPATRDQRRRNLPCGSSAG